MRRFLNKIKKKISGRTVLSFLIMVSTLMGMFPALYFGVDKVETEKPKSAFSHYQFTPTGGQLVTGTQALIEAQKVPAAEGVNAGSWKGTLADDNVHWMVTSTASGINMHLTVGGVQLNNANTLIFQTEIDGDATAPSVLFQVCDWTSSTYVNNAADAQCTGGGWRSLNLPSSTAVAPTTATAYHYQIYDGYFSNGSNVTTSTPLTNFVNGSDQILFRYLSTTNTTTAFAVDYLRVWAIVDPIYSPAGFRNAGAGATAGEFKAAIIGGGQTGSDNNRVSVAGTAGNSAVAEFFLENVQTYTGMNTILMRFETSCSAGTAGTVIFPRAYNFSLGSWTNMGTTGTLCDTTDRTFAVALNNITMSDYLNGDEMRVSIAGQAGAIGIRIDFAYVMLGSTNIDNASSGYEVSFGTSNTNSVTATRDIDMGNGTVTTSWGILSEDEAVTMAGGNEYYAFDIDMDAAATEEGKAANVDFPVTVPTNALVTGVFFAGRFLSGTGGTVQMGVRDYSGRSEASLGGWVPIGATATTAYTYTDSVTVGVANGGIMGMNTDPQSLVNTQTNEMNVRLRTTADNAAATNAEALWDFAFVSIGWTNDAQQPTRTFQYVPSGTTVVTGSASSTTSQRVASLEGINLGDYRALYANDNYHWTIISGSSGYEGLVTFSNVDIYNANALFIQYEFDVDNTAPTTSVQICDFVSSTDVDYPTDANCTGGGWRNIILNASTTQPLLAATSSYMIYDGFFANGSGPVTTPLTNFVNGSDEVKVRFFSQRNVSTEVSIDYVFLRAVTNSVYFPSDITNEGSGTLTGMYDLAIPAIEARRFATSSWENGSDNRRVTVAGTAGTPASFYFSFENVDTYSGMNSILVSSELSCSANGVSYNPRIYNFTSASWENLSASSVACRIPGSPEDATLRWAKNNVTITDYIFNGEVRVGFLATSNSTSNIGIDRMYVMLGTTNTSTGSSACFEGQGTVAAGDCSNTRTLDENGATSTWDVTALDESNAMASAYFPYDFDMDATASEESASMHMFFSVTPPNDSTIAGLLFANRFRGDDSTTGGTVRFGINDAGGTIHYPTTNTGGFLETGQTSNAATFIYSDSISVGNATAGVGISFSPEDFVDTVNNSIWTRLRTTIDGGSALNSEVEWDFGMISLQWVEEVVAPETSITFSISDNAIGFGTLTSSGPRYATYDGLGSDTATSAHSITVYSTASSGFSLTYVANNLTSGASTISSATITNDSDGTPGTEEFAISASSATGIVSPSFGYDYQSGPDWNFSPSTTTEFASSGVATSSVNLDVYYLANISGATEAGSYETTFTYIATGNF